MDKTLNYLKELFGNNLLIEHNKKIDIPIYLSENYFFSYITLDNKSYVLVKNMKKHDINIIYLKKQLAQIQNYTKCLPIYVFDNLRLVQRNNLIKEHIPFVVQNSNVYIPTCLINLNDKEFIPNEYKETFSVATQVVFIYLLLNDIKEINAPQLVNKIPYSKITFNRALKELEERNLVYVKGTNTRKVYKILDKKEFWIKGKEFLFNPVEKVFYVDIKTNHKDLFISNETALARLGTSLNENSTMYFASTSEKVKCINKENFINKYDIINDNYYIVEQFKYNPSFLSENNYIDVISLYAELKENNDERIQIALEELVEGDLFDKYKWFK